jgi:hypothetical protein
MFLFVRRNHKNGKIMKLSEHFTLEEFVASDTARVHHIDNTPPDDAVKNLRKLCINVLEPARKMTQSMIHITSGYRCAKLNELVGGAKNSQHVKGQAADLRIYTQFYTNNLVNALKALPYDQLILEQSGKMRWVHVSYADKPRHQLINLWGDAQAVRAIKKQRTRRAANR